MIVQHVDVSAALRRLAIPIAAAMVGDQLLGIADTVAIGALGTNELAAATAATTVFAAIGIAAQGLSSGVGVLGAQAIGAEQFAYFGRIVRAAAVLPVAIAVAIAIGAAFGGRALIAVMLGPLPTVDAGAQYFSLRCVSLIPMVLSGVALSALGAAGNTKITAVLLALINAVHIPLLLILALGTGTHRPLGLLGAGFSSLVAESIGAVYALFSLARRPQLQAFRRFELDWRLAGRSALLGLPQAVYLLLVLVPDVVIVAFLAPLGARDVAAYRALALVSDLTLAVPIGLENATQTVLGQRFGARDASGARTFQAAASRYGLWLSALAGIVVACAAWPLAALVTLNADLASLAALPLALHMLTLPLKGYALVNLAPMRAAGDTAFPMLVGAVASVSVVPLAWTGVTLLHLGLFAVPGAWIGGWIFWCALVYARLRRFDWSASSLVPAKKPA